MCITLDFSFPLVGFLIYAYKTLGRYFISRRQLFKMKSSKENESRRKTIDKRRAFSWWMELVESSKNSWYVGGREVKEAMRIKGRKWSFVMLVH